MSEILWTHRVVPPKGTPVGPRVFDVYDPPLVIPRTCMIPRPTRELVELPDRRSYRSLSRAGVLLQAAGLPAREVLARFERARVGIYAASETGPQNYRAARELVDAREGFAAEFRKRNHPKLYFTQLANLQASQLAICLDVRGPVNVYKHSALATLHAFEQAEFDLATGLIDAALLCAAMSLDDPLACLRLRRAIGARVLSEGAGALVLGRGEKVRDWAKILDGSEPGAGGDVCHGIAGPILGLIDKEESH
ncbi:MAG: hypothetical protein GY719_32650 [bacterium]|nr:hypothetical protein [bacterium]